MRSLNQIKKLQSYCYDRYWQAKTLKYRIMWKQRFNSLRLGEQI